MYHIEVKTEIQDSTPRTVTFHTIEEGEARARYHTECGIQAKMVSRESGTCEITLFKIGSQGNRLIIAALFISSKIFL